MMHGFHHPNPRLSPGNGKITRLVGVLDPTAGIAPVCGTIISRLWPGWANSQSPAGSSIEMREGAESSQEILAIGRVRSH